MKNALNNYLRVLFRKLSCKHACNKRARSVCIHNDKVLTVCIPALINKLYSIEYIMQSLSNNTDCDTHLHTCEYGIVV